MRTRAFTFSSDPMPAEKGPSSRRDSGRHRPVLLHEAVDALSIHPGDIVVDGTLGESGHAQEIVKRLGKEGVFIGFDADSDSTLLAEKALSGALPQVHIVNTNFRHLAREIESRGITHISSALFDLGWNRGQLERGRGFSFLKNEPLLMTYEKTPGLHAVTAEKAVNTWSEETLADIFFGFGEERFSRRIARAIVERRAEKPFTSAEELGVFLKSVVPGAARSRIHPGTRVFQALRMAVNDELGAITDGLTGAWKLLQTGGRIAVITFHSVEDRHVKRFFQALEKSEEGKRVFKKPLTPSIEELQENPRARSAKLRVCEKL